MRLIRPSVLLLALGMSAPAWYQYTVDEIQLDEALGRYLIAVAAAAVMLAMLRMVTANYGKKAEPEPLNLQGRQPQVVQPEPLSGDLTDENRTNMTD